MNNKGFSLIEVMVSVAIVTILSISFTALTLQAVKVGRVNASELKARMYLQEEMEAVIDLEQSDWTKLAACSICHAEISSSGWIISSGSETKEGIYERYLTITDEGADKKKVKANISWLGKSLTIESYVYNY